MPKNKKPLTDEEKKQRNIDIADAIGTIGEGMINDEPTEQKSFSEMRSAFAKKGPFKMAGMSFKGESPVKNGKLTAEQKKIRQARLEKEAKARNTKKAQELYLKDRSSRTGGIDLSLADKKTQIEYQRRAQKA